MKLIKRKQEISEVERKIIEKGDNGENFEKPEEIQIYVNNLIRNKRYYIQKKLSYYEGTMPLKMLLFIFLIAFLGMSYITEALGIVLSHQLLLVIAGSGVFSLALFANSNISAFKFACQSYNKQIQELSEKCQKIEQKTGSSKPLQIDAFINNIKSDIIRAGNIQYPGFEQDIQELSLLATQYLESKQQAEITNGIDILIQDKKWIQELVKIEMRISHGESRKQEEMKNAATISMIQALSQEKATLEGISTPSSAVTAEEETTGNKGIVLTLGGK